MKKYFTLPLLMFLLFNGDAYTQQWKGSYGIFSGISLNTNSYNYDFGNTFMDTSFTNDIKPALNIGAFLIYDFAENFGLKLEGQYTNKGGYTNVPGFYGTSLTPIDRKYRTTIDYIQFSLLPQLNFPFDRKMNGKNVFNSRIYLNAGGYLSVKMGAQEFTQNLTLFQQQYTEKDISGSITGTDAGFIFGGGVVYRGFMFEIRYDLGLSNIVEDTALKNVLNINNRSINISAGWTGGF